MLASFPASMLNQTRADSGIPNRFCPKSSRSNVLVGLPPVLWWVVTFGALMSVVLIWLQDMEIHVHLILGGILASILGAVIFLIAMLDNSFRGGIGFGPDSIALVYETLMKPDGNGTAAGDAHQQPSPGSAPR